MKSLLIIGAGGHGSVVADAARCTGEWSQIEFFDERWPTLLEHAGHRVAGDLHQLRSRAASVWPGDVELVVAIGDNSKRLALTREFVAGGAHLATVVHPSAVVSASAEIGAGTVVFARAVVNPGCVIGVACIVNTGALVDHDVRLAEGVHVCPGVALAGNVTIGAGAWIGIGSCVMQGVKIGERATVGAGSVVIRDVAPAITVAGNPARKIRDVD